MKKFSILLICFILLVPSKSYGAINPKDQAKVILYTGLYGAVLGLSTLSFYSSPSKHTRNIAMGAALGLIVSVVFSTVLATKKDKERIQTELLNKTQEPVQKDNAGGALKDKDGKEIDKKNKPDGFLEDDLFDKEEEGDGEDFDDEYMYNDQDVEFKLFFASISKNNINFNPDFIIINQNPINNNLEFYGKVLSFRF